MCRRFCADVFHLPGLVAVTSQPRLVSVMGTSNARHLRVGLRVQSVLQVIAVTIALTVPQAHAVVGFTVAESAQAQYARPNRLVDIGGRQLNLYCIGAGSPTVVFESGATLAGWDWLQVHQRVGQRTTACVYDRAGLGFSDPPNRPTTSSNAVDDLHALLTTAALAPRFVLVGHSYGAMNVQLFAYRYPNLMSGLVLVDGHHEDALRRLDQITRGKMSEINAMFDAWFAQCTAQARAGFVPNSESAQQCIGAPPTMFGRALTAAYFAQMLSPIYWQTSSSELLDLNTLSADQLRAARQSFGNLPLRVLTRGVSPYQIPGKPVSAMNRAGERDNKAVLDEVAKLSSKGSNRVVPGAGHAIHIDNPTAVVDAVFEVLSMARMVGR